MPSSPRRRRRPCRCWRQEPLRRCAGRRASRCRRPGPRRGWAKLGARGARNRSGGNDHGHLGRRLWVPLDDTRLYGRWSRRLSTAEVEHFTIPAVGCRLAIVSWLRKRTHGRPASTPVAAPDPGEGAWLRRSPAGGWSLTLKQRHQGHHQSCGSLAEAAGLIAEQDDVSRVYLWSDSRSGYRGPGAGLTRALAGRAAPPAGVVTSRSGCRSPSRHLTELRCRHAPSHPSRAPRIRRDRGRR